MRRILSFLLSVVLLLGAALPASAASIHFADVPSLLRPGRLERIGIQTTSAGPVTLSLQDSMGETLFPIFEGIKLAEGVNHVTWNGCTRDGRAVAEGWYQLAVTQGDDTATANIAIGPESPQLSISVADATLTPGQDWTMNLTLNMPGQLHISMSLPDGEATVLDQQVDAGSLTIAWDGAINGQPVAAGQHMLSFTLTDAEGFSSNTHHLLLTLVDQPTMPPATAVPQTPEPVATPAPHYRIPSMEPLGDKAIGSSYWTLPVGEWNEEAIWKVMMQPITVITGKDQRLTYKLRATPDASTKKDNVVGELTYASQGVNVIEQRDDGWSLVEFFNSSYGPNCASRRGYGNTDDLIRGYVETQYLTQITPRTDFGLLIDKLKQEMYVFKEGKLLTTLMISTGKPTRQQPWNETPSGEFLMVSRTGDFPAGNLTCAMGMRINGGCLIHEVPYLTNAVTQYRDYSAQEAQLGTKASHGCVRVQRKNNSDGMNMTWLWNNIKVNTKVLIWDDAPGRFYEYPSDDMMLYYNPTGGKFYHLDQNCRSIRDRYLPLKGSFTYAQLDDAEYRKLTPCSSCNPPIRKSEIDEINRKNGF